MICSILRQVEQYGSVLSKEGDRLKVENPGALPDLLKQQIRLHKPKLLEYFSLEEQARNSGWLVYPYGECFEKHVALYSYVFIFAEQNDTYTVWRGTWHDNSHPSKEKIIVEMVDLKTALQRAENYVKWFQK
ncbi:hypothetical protein NP92_14550 [Anoxybacillus gonensis]|jgi:hypothetical protein|uniref:TubC N-terminal docking domain-containing protein n=1 Tax=Anoxybacillus gonensis TaxID=198467 RepID=A0AAW7TLJ6_9BACL|nr:hypothetical protein [Anoxybacillus gonensis]KGP59371.1 hypothetical protein NP92_14550 [Anoxybacillus gonensis]MDO0878781.1 hypothetical protein [Anoxybacillus gonensis]